MRFLMTPVGSAGDVHPYIGVGRALRVRGHDVCIISTGNFRDAIERAGVTYVEAGTADEYEQVTKDPDIWHPRKGLSVIAKATTDSMRRVFALLEDHHVPGSTVVVGHALGFAARVFEERRRVPAATLQLAPAVFRSDHRQPALPNGIDPSTWPLWLKRGAWWALDRYMIDPTVAPALNAWRAELGLPAVSRVFRSWLNSPQRVIGLFPPWFAPPQPDWPPALRLTGFPLFDESDPSKAADLDGGAETQDLRRFLDEGGAPIAFTPGTANAHAQRFLQAGVEAAVRLNRRALLLTRRGHQVPRDLPPSIRHVSYAPFSQLLPRCAALVHHGGIGTCAQALAAGIPQLVMPMGFDQPDNAARLKRLGVGAALVPAKFTGARVASELTTLLSHPAAAAACRHWSQAIAASRPIDETCDLLERIA